MKNQRLVLLFFILISLVFFFVSCSSISEEVFLETERPELTEETRALIAQYQKNPTEENRETLRQSIASSYDKVVEKKKAKLQELRETAKEQSKIDEMYEIVQDMLTNREAVIESTLNRFTDPRLKPGLREVTETGFLTVLGLKQNIGLSYTEVTNAEYAVFLQETGYSAPRGWSENLNPDYPVVNVSYFDALAYCGYLTGKSETAIYRLPTEEEWEQAAGHMSKDAPFNSGRIASITSVYEYKDTLSACGAIDMWGNVWEWTSTDYSANSKTVKGGAYNTERTQCRTENREEGRLSSQGYPDVGFRVVMEIK